MQEQERKQPEKSLRDKTRQEMRKGGVDGCVMEMGRKICLWQEKETKPAHY